MDNLKDIIEITLKQIEKVSNTASGISGIPTGFKDLDSSLCGFDNSDLIVIGARPCMGKTALIISLALNMAKENIPVLFYSFEMSDTQLVKRMLTNISGVNGHNIESSYLSAEDWEKLMQYAPTLSSYPLYLPSDVPTKIEDFCEKVIADVEATKAKIVFVDYLQLFSAKEKYQNRYEEVAACTRALKLLARQLNIPIVVGSQINRNPEHRSQGHIEFYHPHMHDLRDSGTICEDANVVLLLDRPEVHAMSYYDAEGNNIKGALNVKIAKNHMGGQDSVRLLFKPEICRVENWSTFDEFYPQQDSPINFNLGDKESGTIESPF